MSKFRVGDLAVVTKDRANYSPLMKGDVVKLLCTCTLNGWDVSSKRGEWSIEETYLEPYEKAESSQKIIITHDNHTTKARLYEGDKLIKSAEAKCSPSDKFGFKIGARLAFDRLCGEEKKEEKKESIKLYCVKDCNGYTFTLRKGDICTFDGRFHTPRSNGSVCADSYSEWAKGNQSYAECLIPLISRPAKVGEWVYVLNSKSARDYCHGVKPGDVLEMDGIKEKPDAKGFVWGSGLSYLYGEYLVLDGYKPEPEVCKCCGKPL